jgi:hypothetical protein
MRLHGAHVGVWRGAEVDPNTVGADHIRSGIRVSTSSPTAAYFPDITRSRSDDIGQHILID